jgi:prepilin-type N-terminal cleavage/methylation domain-containing protein
MKTRVSSRQGFSLIELLVVIGILTILAALLAAAVMRMRGVPPQKNTELLIQKLAKSLEQQWTAVITQCKVENVQDPVNAPLWVAAGGNVPGADPQQVMAAYTNLRLQQEFPTTFLAAAQSGKVAYKGLPAAPAPTAQGNGFEGSILLYLALTVGRRGMQFDDAFSPKEARAVPGFPSTVQALYDGWDQPLQFNTMIDPKTGYLKFIILSAGADQKAGTNDDINSDTLRVGR